MTREVIRVLTAQRGTADPAVLADAKAAGDRTRREVGAEVRRLLEADIDEQRTTPLAILRAAVSYPTAVLRRAGAAAVDRDDFTRRAFPDDDYDLTPATFGDVDPALREPGLVWGAAKAYVHLGRHRPRADRS